MSQGSLPACVKTSDVKDNQSDRGIVVCCNCSHGCTFYFILQLIGMYKDLTDIL
jgi:hypothetical protein